MAKKRRAPKVDEAADVPLSAMIDVVFLLLIYFIVTHKEKLVETHMAINLPAPSQTPGEPKPQLTEVHIVDSQYYLRGRNMNIEELGAYLEKAAALDKEQTVIVKVSQNSMEKALIGLLDRCHKAGLKNLNVLTFKEQIK